MSVRYLLDEHISPRVVDILAHSGIDAVAAARSPHAGYDDRALLSSAVADGRLLVTYNIDDFAPIFGDFIKEGRAMAGIVFIDTRTIPPDDIRGLARALRGLAEKIDRGAIDPSGCVFLTRE